jgi:hypothetical protein
MRLIPPALLLALAALPASAQAPAADPRVGLKAGVFDAGTAIKGMRLVATVPKPAPFDPTGLEPGFGNSDLAFQGTLVFQGNYAGFMVWDVADPARPRLRHSVYCPGNQGDPSVFGNLLFISIQATSARLDCGDQGVADTVSTERFRGVRIYDISNVEAPRVVASVQTCRGSHTHTLVTDPADPENVYVYVSGTSVVRSGRELPGCSGRRPEEDPNTSLFRIEVIQVPLQAPHLARIVNTPRLFADRSGAVAGLWRGGTHGEGTQRTAETNMCHDITAYPALGLAAGACSGNGLLIDIREPANPQRLDEVSDPNFAYWHSATFSNDGSKVLFTDEWGGGSAPRCRATDRPEWGANAIYTLRDNRFTPASFFKLPAAQTDTENCVAHNGSLIPVPGRDIFVQGWYQGGVSIIDFTDAAHPFEIGYFDRGPMSATEPIQAGQWSTYWYNGYIYGSEIARGLDVLELVPTEHLTRNEIEAAKLVRLPEFNAQLQPRFTWPAHFAVARAYLDQLVRGTGLPRARTTRVARDLDRAERLTGPRRQEALARLATELENEAGGAADAPRVRALAGVVRALAQAD